jgi:tetratricopeptide (TPR) repeat protein
MNAASPDEKQKAKRSGIYFVLAALLLLAMASVWALDTSIIYILFGAAVFFLFLGFWNRPRPNAERVKYSSFHSAQGKKRDDSPDFLKTLIDFFSKQKTFSQQQTQSPPQQAAGKFVALVAMFIFLIFAVTIIAAIFSSDETTSTDVSDAYQRAEQFRGNGEYDSADRYYRIVLSQQPDYPEALTGYAHNWLARERYDSALAYFDNALSVDPEYENASYGRALTFNYQKKYKESLRETFSLMRRAPDYRDAVLLAGDNYYLQQRYDSAIYWYEDAYKQGERSAVLCHVMAYIYDTQGHQQKAIQFYREALGYDSTRIEVYSRLGELITGKDGEFYKQKVKQLKEQGY